MVALSRAGLAPLRAPAARTGFAFLAAFGLAAAGVGAARALTTTFLPVLLDRIHHSPGLIGAVMLVNAAAGFLVPIVVGVWSDRRAPGRLGRRLPFLVGGAILTAGGLLAVALGHASSYALLALAATAVYVGLNAAATAHRAIVPEGFPDDRRPAATSAQEVAMLLGGMVGILGGGVLVGGASPALAFVLGAVLVLVLLLPTLAVVAGRSSSAAAPASPTTAPPRARDLAEALRRPGAGEVLVAQVLWVLAYAALPAFFILYAEDVLGLSTGAAAALPAAFGVLTGVAMVGAGRTRPERVLPLLCLGAALLGAGLLGAAPADTVALAAPGFAAAAIGMGLVTALGFPYFARFIPPGSEGSYSGLYFAVRAIASAVALPGAGLAVQATGSYRALLLLGVGALVALIPLGRAERRHRRPAPVPGAPPRTVAAVVPCYASERVEAVVAEALRHVDEVVVVDDGAPAHVADPIDRVAAWPRVRLVRLPVNCGKGDAVAAGAEPLLARAEPPDAIVVLDADGQHPPERIPDLVAAAAEADVVIGDRRADRAAMPRVRRATNAISSALLSARFARRLPDTQCGMRLYRREALQRVPLVPGRYEAETRHLKASLAGGLRVEWVPIPAIYGSEGSSFRPVADTARVLAAILGPARPLGLRGPGRAFWRHWGARLGAVVAGTLAIGAAMPLLQGLDHRLFTSVNALGAGPHELYEALDPHSRNYVLLSLAAVLAAAAWRRRAVAGVAAAVVLAAFFSDVLVQAVYLLYNRPRPEEALGAEALLVEGRTWAHIASFPSGHMVVTTAIAVAAMSLVPRLRGVLWSYVALIALTRITFGAHFPLDVVVGAVFGYVCGRFSAELVHRMGALPDDEGVARALPWPALRLGRPALARGRAGSG